MAPGVPGPPAAPMEERLILSARGLLLGVGCGPSFGLDLLPVTLPAGGGDTTAAAFPPAATTAANLAAMILSSSSVLCAGARKPSFSACCRMAWQYACCSAEPWELRTIF